MYPYSYLYNTYKQQIRRLKEYQSFQVLSVLALLQFELYLAKDIHRTEYEHEYLSYVFACIICTVHPSFRAKLQLNPNLKSL